MKRTVLLMSVAILGLGCTLLGTVETKPDPRFEGKSLTYWVERLQKAEKPDERRAAAEAIKTFGPNAKEAVPALTQLLHDRSDTYRQLAAEILSALGPDAKQAAPALAKALGDPSPTVRLAVAVALWNVEKNPRVVPVLTKLLGETGFAEDRTMIVCEAAEALGRVGPQAREAIPELRKAALSQDHDFMIHVAAKQAIEMIDPREAKKIQEEWDKQPHHDDVMASFPPMR